MANVKVSRTKEGILLSGSLPAELSSAQEMEIFPLRDGAYLLVLRSLLPHAIAAASSGARGAEQQMSETEKSVVRKLLSVRFEKRTPEEAGRLLSKEEKETLAGLMKKNLVQVFHKGKYEKEGVYNVSDFAFNSVREPPAQAPSQPPQVSTDVSSVAHLEKSGWMVLEDENAARAFGSTFPEKVRSGEVRGMRAFDRKYYFITRRFAEEWEKKVQLALSKSEKGADELAGEVGMEAVGCRALLYHLCESGEVMEKHRGKPCEVADLVTEGLHEAAEQARRLADECEEKLNADED